MRRFLTGTLFVTGFSGAGLAADLSNGSAPTPEPIVQSSPWTFALGAYAFIPLSVQGSSTVNGGTVDLDLGPNEIFNLFQFAISGRIEGWRDLGKGDGSAFGFVLDGQYVNLGDTLKNVGPLGSGKVDIDVRQGIVDMLAGYRFPTIGRGSETGTGWNRSSVPAAPFTSIRSGILS